jgi:cysteine-rich repeat protein
MLWSCLWGAVGLVGLSGCSIFAFNLDTCGDGILNASTEVCDDNNTDGGDGCNENCTGFEVCGDGVIDAFLGETCDDKNTDGGDGCDTLCQIELGFQCEDEPSLCNGICGDGLLRGAEQCDDANTNAGDGCDAVCRIERGFSCAGEPSTCNADCGDGNVAGTETCDDANNENGDGCDQTCQIDVDALVNCGGNVQAGEFPTIAAALDATIDTPKPIIGVLSGPVCNESVSILNRKDLLLVGFGSLNAPPQINGDEEHALLVDNNKAEKVTIRHFFLVSDNDDGGTVITQGKAQTFLQQVAIQNRDGIADAFNNTSLAVDCISDQGGGNDGITLIDQSVIFSTFGGGLRARNKARVIISNSLLFDNGFEDDGILENFNDSLLGGLSVINDAVLAAVFVVLDSNIKDEFNDTAMDCQFDGASGKGFLNSSIIINNNNNAQIDSECIVTGTNQFQNADFLDDVDNPLNIGNINADPLFTAPGNLNNLGGYRLNAGSPSIDTARPDLIEADLPFDAETIFGVDPLDHDFDGNPRAADADPQDMGIFEIP